MDPTPEDRAARLKAAKDAQGELFGLVKDVISDLGEKGLAAAPGLVDRMEEIAGRFGLVSETLAAQLKDLRQATAAVDHRTRLSNAAEWAGDMNRLTALQDMPWPDTRHLLNLPQGLADAEEDDAPWEDDAAFDQAVLPDPYEDLADGVPGALAALLASGQDLNLLAGPYGRTALQAALEPPGRRAEGLHRLIAAGADPALPGPMGEDAIFCAVGYRHTDSVTAASERQVFDVLFRAGSSPNAPSDAFGTAMLASVLLGSPVEVGVMLDAGGRLDAVMPNRYPGYALAGYTALMLAAPKPATFRLLLQRGADPARPCPGGESLIAFLQREVARAEELSGHDDWCRAHAQALAESLALLTSS